MVDVVDCVVVTPVDVLEVGNELDVVDDVVLDSVICAHAINKKLNNSVIITELFLILSPLFSSDGRDN